MTERALEQERQRRARLANMRHELLAPVTALVGYSELLIEKHAASSSKTSARTFSVF